MRQRLRVTTRVWFASFALLAGATTAVSAATGAGAPVEGTVGAAAPSGGMTLTLEGAVELAQRTATTVAKAGLTKDVTGRQLMQAYAQYLPNLTSTAGLGYSAGKQYYTQALPTNTNGKDYGANLQLQSTLNIFNGFSDQAGLKAAMERDSAAEWTLARAREQIAVDVTQAFLQVILDQDLVVIAQKNLEVSKSRQELLEEQARIGAKDLATLYRQQAQTAADEASMIAAQNKLHTDIILLTRRLRLDPGVHLTTARPELERAPGRHLHDNIDTLVHEALEQRKDLKAAVNTATAADAGITVARSGYYPKLDFAVTAGSDTRTLLTHVVNGNDDMPGLNQESTSTQLKDHIIYTAGLTMTWLIFDRELVRTTVEQAAADAKSAELDREDLSIQVAGEVRQAMGDYQAAIKRFDAAKEGSRAAKEAFDAVQGRYNVGAASFIDLTTSQTALAQAESDQAQARIDVFLQARLIEFYVGTH